MTTATVTTPAGPVVVSRYPNSADWWRLDGPPAAVEGLARAAHAHEAVLPPFQPPRWIQGPEGEPWASMSLRLSSSLAVFDPPAAAGQEEPPERPGTARRRPATQVVWRRVRRWPLPAQAAAGLGAGGAVAGVVWAVNWLLTAAAHVWDLLNTRGNWDMVIGGGAFLLIVVAWVVSLVCGE